MTTATRPSDATCPATVTRLIIVGCGHMGLAIARGLLGGPPGPEIVVVDTDAERRKALAEYDGLTVTGELDIAEGDFVTLAVPPQVFADFADAERHRFTPRTPVLSVMAGLTSRSIAAALNTSQVVRSIPNTPSEVFEGMSVYFADAEVSADTVARAEALLGVIGKVLRVDAEELVDDATALCGGGPAFVSYIVDAFCRFAVSRGFSEEASREMTVQVFAGTAALIEESGKPPMQLCHEVMTPNGTTERGIAAFDAADLGGSVVAALAASARRSRELASVMSR
ncbi:pyrroline-5-carboxylate reductase [Streptomyces sp. NBC_01257]|uniref:pyrroline-5-carboxylate reductase n=1 Tax=Streptomyces sp. NBC_01257 TaxID=2903799 RepID=UPI002DDA2ED3|nr:pyrroline-5-carboxylate reductase [Streptomyces sp. NBC_01257]WRZ68299.1 pyrroline-5-carboxylate reductase [Streptomyces sp. NBC_01257]